MHDHLVLVDGYNIIRRSPSLAKQEHVSLEHGRRALITLLAARAAARRNIEIVAVFDGDAPRETRESHLGIAIVFSAQGVTADECLMRLAQAAEARGQRVTVATDDAGLRVALGGVAPATSHQSASALHQELHAADRVREKQFRHRTAIRALLDADGEPRPPHHRRRGSKR
jgi:predicted RNA-binding protein with PIN domain